MKKKNSKTTDSEEETMKGTEDENIGGEDSAIDPSIIEDTFAEEFSEYNDTDF